MIIKYKTVFLQWPKLSKNKLLDTRTKKKKSSCDFCSLWIKPYTSTVMA